MCINGNLPPQELLQVTDFVFNGFPAMFTTSGVKVPDAMQVEDTKIIQIPPAATNRNLRNGFPSQQFIFTE